MIAIEKGVPIPKPSGGPMPGTGKRQRIIKQMRVGDSVLVANLHEATALNVAAKSLGLRVTMRKQPSGNVRVWRVAK